MSSIPLMVQPPQPVQGPITQAQQGASLAGLLQQQRIQQQMAPGQMQLQQQAIQTGQQEQQLRQIQIQDAQAGQKALQDWDGNDPDALPDLIRKNGGSFNAVMSARQGILGMKTAAQKLQTDQLDNLGKTNDIIAGHLESVKGAADKQSAFDGAVSDLEQKGLIKPGQISHQYPGDDQLNLLEKQFMTQKTITDQELAARKQTTEEQAKQLETEKFGAELPGGVLEDPTKKYLRLSAAEDAGQKLSAPDAAFVKAFGQKMDRESTLRHNLQLINPFIPGGGLPGAPIGPAAPGAPATSGAPTAPNAQAAGGAPAKPTPAIPATNTTPAQISAPGIERVPEQIRPQVQAILDYRAADVPQGRSNPMNQAINYWVNAIDPQHDTVNFPAKNKILQQYTKDMASGSLGAINTALGHLNELQIAAKAVEQNNVPLLNSIANKFGVAIGSDAPTTYTAILHRVGPEMTSAYVKGGGGEGERGANEADFDISKGAKQIESNINESAMLLNSKLAAQRKNWEDTFKPYRDSDQFDNRFLTPDAKQILNTASAKAPTAQAAKAAIPSAGNAKYHYGGGKGEIFSNDGKTWFDSTGKQVTSK